jgi:rfaE bifunctional protein nucleotidyltransferase chain/domain
MKKIINLQKAIRLSKKIKAEQKTLVITGGCFDILHIGHIKLLEKSKEQGDYLLVLVENDNTVSKLKGKDRPINSEIERAKVLSAISFVDYVLILPDMTSNNDYDLLIQKLKPNVITNIKGDPQNKHNIRQAKLVNAKVVSVMKRFKNKSTTNLAKIIEKHFT